MTKDEKYISRCIQLAKNGLCNTAPNPMVGAVIVHEDRIIGEGYHVRCGEAHAEVNAIRSVKNPALLRQSTLYVSLEPCAHYGKTPPCADLIVEKGIPRVVVGCIDPFPLVSGRGIHKLRKAGIEVKVGVQEEACRNLIRRFIISNRERRPYITLKWAQSANGFIDAIRESGAPVKFSTPLTSAFVHKLRAEHKAILVGRRTALFDNPSLTVREWYGRSPLRLVIDRNLTLPPDLHLFDGEVPTRVFTSLEHALSPDVESVRIDFGTDIIPQIAHYLYEEKIQSLLVEGGSQTIRSFIRSGLWDEIYVEHSHRVLGKGIQAPVPPQETFCEYFYKDNVCFSHYIREYSL